MMSLSASTILSEKTAVGLNVISDKAGLQQRMQVMGSFAYRLPIDDDHNVRFGMSLAWGRESLDLGLATKGSTADVALSNYNDSRRNVLDGNVGVAYQFMGIEAQFSYLNLNQKRARDLSTVDYSTFYTSLSYRYTNEETFSFKPLIAYRGIRGYKNQWDAGAQWEFMDAVNAYTMFHSNQSFSLGGGYRYQDKLNFSVIYNTEPNQVRGFTGGIIDLALGYSF
jgi:type IX secretion system PorP/SprF family membrane protein